MNSTQDSTAPQKSLFARYQEHITSAIFIGLVLGILTGLFLASRFDVVLTVTTLLGSIYMNALNMMIFPLVFCENRNVEHLRNALEAPLGYASNDLAAFTLSLLGEEMEAAKPVVRPFPNVDGVRIITHVGGCGGTAQGEPDQ